jgi:hypothetical protein
MLKRIATACIDRRPRLLDGSSAAESVKPSLNKPVVDGGDRVAGGASTVQEQEADIDRMEAQQVCATRGKSLHSLRILARIHPACCPPRHFIIRRH